MANQTFSALRFLNQFRTILSTLSSFPRPQWVNVSQTLVLTSTPTRNICEPHRQDNQMVSRFKKDPFKGKTWNFGMDSFSGPQRENVRMWDAPEWIQMWDIETCLQADWNQTLYIHTRMVCECQHPAHFCPAHNAFNWFWDPRSWDDA